MFFDEPYSEAGRTTHMTLNSLRRQLGMGVDPAFDYSKMVELQKELTAKQEMKKKGDTTQQADAGSSPTSGLEQLRRALRDVVGGPGAEDDENEEAEGGSLIRRSSSSPADARELRDRTRPSPSFRVCSRNDLNKLDISNRFRAPPPGTYRPKDEWMRPRLKNTDFGERQPTKSLKTAEMEKEIERLKAEDQPYDHLTKHAVSVEMLEDYADKAKMRPRDLALGKQLPRPDLLKPVGKAAGITYHDNSFTEGVADGDYSTSKLLRNPVWDITKCSTGKVKDETSYFQPKTPRELKTVRAHLDLKNVPFEKQPPRKPLRETVGRVEIKKRITSHLPDRSETRRTGPTQEKRMMIPNLKKYTTRPELKAAGSFGKEYHNVDDPSVDEAVMGHSLTFDITATAKVLQPRLRPSEDFNKSLTRNQHFQTMRTFGQDLCVSLAKEFQSRGDALSVEKLPLDAVDSHPSLRNRVAKIDNFERMGGRDPEKQFCISPSRNRDLSKASKFERETRDGDSRSTVALSQLTKDIGYMRETRSYQALPREEYPLNVNAG